MKTRVLRDITAVIGHEAAMNLIADCGSTRVYIPGRAPGSDNHWLVDAIGREATERLCAHYRMGGASEGYRGGHLSIPLGPNARGAVLFRAVKSLTKNGLSGNQIALELGINERSVRKMRARARAGHDQ